MPDKKVPTSEEGAHYIYRRFITTKSGRKIYPKKGRCFRILIKE